ncbi:MAG: TIGR00341 family protein [Cyclonatronaceae bacterium]
MKFTLVYDAGQEEEVRDTLLPLVEEIISEKHAFSAESTLDLPDGQPVLLYLSDHQIKAFLAAHGGPERILAALPHPNAPRFSAITGTDSGLKKAVAQLKERLEAAGTPEEHEEQSEKESGEPSGMPGTVEIDLMYSNGRPVFSSVVIGRTFLLATSKFFGSIGFWKRTRHFLGSFLKLRPFRVDVLKKDDSRIKTAVTGIVVVPYRTYSLLSRFIPEEPSVHDGMIHALLVSPRSIMELLGYAVRSLWQKSRLPGLGGHIKTGRLRFAGPEEELTFTEDGDSHSARELTLEVRKRFLKVVPGARLTVPEEGPASNEIFRTSALPTGEAAIELCRGKLPLLRRASSEEFKDLFQILRDNARPKGSYLVLMVISTVLATLGLFADSAPVVIGAMILAPLMAPIISLSMASLRQDRRLVLNSAYTILAGLGLSFAFAVAITWITPIHTPNSEILARTSPNLLDLGIAVVSGIAGAYAHAREEIAKTLAGVAIAVALVPPLAVAGIGLGWMDWSIFSGAGLLLVTNLAGMVLAGSLTFIVLGFSPFRLATRGVFISLVIVIVFSIPLGFGFGLMIEEHNVIRRLDGWETGEITVRDVRVRSVRPLSLSVTLVTRQPLDPEELDGVKARIEERLNRTVQLEIGTALER